MTITIMLNSGWVFQTKTDNIAVQGYATAPSGNPAPGQFAHKTTADPSSNVWQITVPQSNFYGVHVNVARVVPCGG